MTKSPNDLTEVPRPEENGEPEVELGAETATSPGQAIAEAGAGELVPLNPSEHDETILPVVHLGDSDGWAQHALLWLGYTGDTFTEWVAGELGSPVIDDSVWPSVLPTTLPGDKGLQVVVLRKLLKVGAGSLFDLDVAEALIEFSGDTTVDRETWESLFARALAELGKKG